MLFLLEEIGRCLLFAILPSLWSLCRGRLVPFVLAWECSAEMLFTCANNGDRCGVPDPVVVVVIVVMVVVVVVVGAGRADIVEFGFGLGVDFEWKCELEFGLFGVVAVGAVVAAEPVATAAAAAAAAAMALSSEGTGGAAPVRCCTTSTLDISTLFPSFSRPRYCDALFALCLLALCVL